uniref:Uncharacterized protein n=1 Tax=Globisporangium ultimum (strain ATCC 200006 / CBS 805.95 / DAOM BR144) TaxID=431595 RepID=K3X9W4_GLOUD
MTIPEKSSDGENLSPSGSVTSNHHSPTATGGSPRKTKLHVGASMQDLKLNFFRTKSHKVDQPVRKKEDIGISIVSLRFSNTEMEDRFTTARCAKYHTRLKFGAGFTAFFIPLLVIMQVSFKAKENKEKWTQFPLVMIFPGIVMCMGLLVISFHSFFQNRTHLLSIVCLIGQISALLDTTAAGTSVSERNVWVQFIFSLGITSSTGLTFLQSFGVLSASSVFFIILAWYRFATAAVPEPLSSP